MENIKCVLLDIEGTICPISFVKETLFPYALKALPEVLKTKWDDEGFKQYRDAFPDDAKSSPEALQAHVEDLTKRDVKIAYHKNLQGYLWEHGYKTGEYATPLFADVAPKFKQWKDDGYDLAIYSSGSVFAQKLLFGHVKTATSSAGTKRRHVDVANGDDDAAEPPSKKRTTTSQTEQQSGSTMDDSDNPEDNTKSDKEAEGSESDTITEDLQYLIKDWFDTTNAGPKTIADSYTTIADALQIPPGEILFLSDNVKEVDAGFAAGMEAILVDRPGNAAVSDDDRTRLDVVQSLDEINLLERAAGGESTSRSPEDEAYASSEA